MSLPAKIQGISPRLCAQALQQRLRRPRHPHGQRHHERLRPVRTVRRNLSRTLFDGRSLSSGKAGCRGERRHARIGPRVRAGGHGAGLGSGKRLSSGRSLPCRRRRTRQDHVFSWLSADGIAGRSGACHVPVSSRNPARRSVAVQHLLRHSCALGRQRKAFSGTRGNPAQTVGDMWKAGNTRGMFLLHERAAHGPARSGHHSAVGKA